MTIDLATWRWPGSADVRERAGECYTLAMEAVLENPDWLPIMHLVHGVLHPELAEGWDYAEFTPPANPHAWVELDALDGVMCLDPVMRMAWPRDEHTRLFGAERFRRYRADIAVEVSARNNSFGPWDRRSLDAWEARQVAAREDPRFTREAALERFLS